MCVDPQVCVLLLELIYINKNIKNKGKKKLENQLYKKRGIYYWLVIY